MGKILLHSHLEVFSPIIALDQGEKDLYMFSPMYYVHMLSEMIMLNVCENLSLVWIYSESIGPQREQQ